MIRHATPADQAAIRAVVHAAFGQADEADLVERLRAAGDVMFELVEEDGGEIVGHILYSRLWADSINLYAALAPLSVRPDRQRSGVGKRLTAASLSQTSCAGTPPIACSRAQCPAMRSGACRVGSIWAKIIREYPETITSTGG